MYYHQLLIFARDKELKGTYLLLLLRCGRLLAYFRCPMYFDQHRPLVNGDVDTYSWAFAVSFFGRPAIFDTLMMAG